MSVNWGLADWFSFLTRAVERQFNFFFSLPPGRLYTFFFALSSPKNVNMTLSALSTFSAVTDITWPQFMKGTEETHSCSTIWIYYHPTLPCVRDLRIIFEGFVGNPNSLHLNKTKVVYMDAKRWTNSCLCAWSDKPYCNLDQKDGTKCASKDKFIKLLFPENETARYHLLPDTPDICMGFLSLFFNTAVSLEFKSSLSSW